MTSRNRWLIALTVVCIAAAFFAPAIPQPVSYHLFADQRRAFEQADERRSDRR